MDALRDINRRDGITVLCNLHTLDTARAYCGRIIGMSEGRIVFDGRTEQLWMTRRHRQIYGTATMTMDSGRASDAGETLEGARQHATYDGQSVAIGGVAVYGRAWRARADDTLKQFRLGLLGGENTQDRLARYDEFQQLLSQRLGMPVKLFPDGGLCWCDAGFGGWIAGRGGIQRVEFCRSLAGLQMS